jgi:hypothetical protein
LQEHSENNDQSFDCALQIRRYAEHVQHIVDNTQNNAPITVPKMDPLPPDMDVPPMTTAAIASNS